MIVSQAATRARPEPQVRGSNADGEPPRRRARMTKLFTWTCAGKVQTECNRSPRSLSWPLYHLRNSLRVGMVGRTGLRPLREVRRHPSWRLPGVKGGTGGISDRRGAVRFGGYRR